MMRKILLMMSLLSFSGHVFAADYEETRTLSLSVRGVDLLRVENGSGSIDVVGVPNLADIEVVATVTVPDGSEAKALKTIEKDLRLSLEKDSDVAELVAYFEHRGIFNFRSNGSVQLEIRMPESMHLFIDDGSGSIEIENVRGDVELDDGSGTIKLANVGGQVEIDDGSGSINVIGVGGDISINDGSGGIDVRGVAGSVIVDDGSGGIDVHDVEKDLTIVNDGSGGLDFSDIRGRISTES